MEKVNKEMLEALKEAEKVIAYFNIDPQSFEKPEGFEQAVNLRNQADEKIKKAIAKAEGRDA